MPPKDPKSRASDGPFGQAGRLCRPGPEQRKGKPESRSPARPAHRNPLAPQEQPPCTAAFRPERAGSPRRPARPAGGGDGGTGASSGESCPAAYYAVRIVELSQCKECGQDSSSGESRPAERRGPAGDAAAAPAQAARPTRRAGPSHSVPVRCTPAGCTRGLRRSVHRRGTLRSNGLWCRMAWQRRL